MDATADQIADAVYRRLKENSFSELHARFDKIEEHLDRQDAERSAIKKQVDHLYTSLDERGLI